MATAKKKTLKQFYAYWKQHHAEKRQEAGTQKYNDEIFKRIDDGLGHLRVDKIEPRHLLDFYANLAEPGVRKDIKLDKEGKPIEGQKLVLSATTIRKHHTLIHTLLGAAVKWGFATYNAADRVEAPKADKSKRKILDEAQTTRFLDLLEKEETKQKLMVYLGLTGGLCREEIFGLEWKDLALAAGTIRIDRASVYVPGQGVITKDCKNTHRHRIVSIPPATVDLLKAHRADQIAKRLKLGGTKDKGGQWAGADDPDDDRVFTSWDGTPAHPHSFNTWLGRFCTDNGLPNPGTHGFRHLAATFLITKCGADIRTVADKLGHANPQTTISIIRIYFSRLNRQRRSLCKGS